MNRYLSPLFNILFLILLTTGIATAAQQEQKPDSKPDEKAAPAPPPMSPSARLTAAKTAYLRRTGNGDNAAYDVVSTTLEGWGRFELVNSLDKADIIIEIYSLAESEGGGISASAGGGGGRRGPGGSSRQATASQIRLTVYDSKSKVALWTGTEHPKSALRKTDRENNEVEAAERLIQKFHDQVEPPLK